MRCFVVFWLTFWNYIDKSTFSLNWVIDSSGVNNMLYLSVFLACPTIFWRTFLSTTRYVDCHKACDSGMIKALIPVPVVRPLSRRDSRIFAGSNDDRSDSLWRWYKMVEFCCSITALIPPTGGMVSRPERLRMAPTNFTVKERAAFWRTLACAY